MGSSKLRVIVERVKRRMRSIALFVGLLSATILLNSVAPAIAAEPCRREQRTVARNEIKFVKKQQAVVKEGAKKVQAVDKVDRKIAITGAREGEYALYCALGDERACRRLTKLWEKLARYAQLRLDTIARYDARIHDKELNVVFFHDYELVPSQTALQQCLAG